MIISVINHTSGLLNDDYVQRAIRAVNRQIAEDFEPYWGMSATLRLEGHAGPAHHAIPEPDIQHAIDMRGDAVLYLWHPTDVRGALGYHVNKFLGIPYGFVFPEISRAVAEPWTSSLSHEALELIADPEVNRLVMGPHPAKPNTTVFHWYEVCDAVQTETYEIDGVPLSNFVLPLYFTNSEETGSRNDFLGRAYQGRTLRSFSANPGGYVGYFDPATGQNEAFFLEGDGVGVRRMQIKQQLGLARRSRRYQYRTMGSQSITAAIRGYIGGG